MRRVAGLASLTVLNLKKKGVVVTWWTSNIRRMHAKLLAGEYHSWLKSNQNTTVPQGLCSISAITIYLCPRGSAFHPIHSTACTPRGSAFHPTLSTTCTPKRCAELMPQSSLLLPHSWARATCNACPFATSPVDLHSSSCPTREAL